MAEKHTADFSVDKQVAFNDGGNLAGDADFTWDKASNILTLSQTNVSSTINSGKVLSINSGSDGYSINLTASSGLTNSSSGGAITAAAGQASTSGGNAPGGNARLAAGNGFGTGVGGDVQLLAGVGGNSGLGGAVSINGGVGGGVIGNGDGGSILIVPGLKSGSGINGMIKMIDPTSGVSAILGTASLASSDKTFTFPNTTGTFNVIPATGRATAQTAANTSVVTFTPATDGSFIISANVLITTATLHSFTATVTYTDEGNTSRTVTLNFSTLAGALTPTIANAGGAAPYEGVPLHIRAKASTAITIATSGTFTTVTYNVEGAITQIA